MKYLLIVWALFGPELPEGQGMAAYEWVSFQDEYASYAKCTEALRALEADLVTRDRFRGASLECSPS